MKYGLGFRGNEDWRDISDYVVHLTKPGVDILSILGGQVLKPGPAPFGAARDLTAIAESQRAVCFSEVPLGQLSRLAERRRSLDGLGFTKELLLRRGGLPVWYLAKDTPAHGALHELIASTPREPSEALWRLTPFIDQPGAYGTSEYRFEWEREWRHVGPFRFQTADVALLLLKEDLHAQARAFFEDAYHENVGPAYFCAYIDPRWEEDQVAAAFEEYAWQARKDRQ